MSTSRPTAVGGRVETGRRRGLVVITMFLTGLRNNEVASLRWDWIDWPVVDERGRVPTLYSMRTSMPARTALRTR